jgi:hypothetical protein
MNQWSRRANELNIDCHLQQNQLHAALQKLGVCADMPISFRALPETDFARTCHNRRSVHLL